ncbi:MAG: hypothetical protein IJG37_09210 [Synergistaceae bacterium]|nr:hypothetical protein [Synergistaceae bacterium]MBQ6972576.1 hypothetical protein [Synergistaceae bacterium]
MSYKDSPRIELRGRLDSLNARIILLQSESDSAEYIADLEELRAVVNRLQRCEACGENFGDDFTLWGLGSEELHTRSHNPAMYCGLGHIMPHHEMGRLAAGLNVLRTLVRETELCAVRAFSPAACPYGVGDDDGLRICHVLNRLSSAVYVLMYKYLPEGYSRVIRFGSSG